MQFSDIKQSAIIINGGAQVATLRGHLNSAYSTAPAELGEVFDAALDQVADQQIKVTEALMHLIKTEDLAGAEAAIQTAVREAERAALRVARSYAENQAKAATEDNTRLAKIPRDNAGLISDKRTLDERFYSATKLHEKDDIAAFHQLLDCARMFKEWSAKVEEAIIGTQGIIMTEKRRIRLQSTAIVLSGIAIVLTIINLVISLLRIKP